MAVRESIRHLPLYSDAKKLKSTNSNIICRTYETNVTTFHCYHFTSIWEYWWSPYCHMSYMRHPTHDILHMASSISHPPHDVLHMTSYTWRITYDICRTININSKINYIWCPTQRILLMTCNLHMMSYIMTLLLESSLLETKSLPSLVCLKGLIFYL